MAFASLADELGLDLDSPPAHEGGGLSLADEFGFGELECDGGRPTCAPAGMIPVGLLAVCLAELEWGRDCLFVLIADDRRATREWL